MRDIIFITNKGHGARIPVEEFRVTSRGSKGTRSLACSDDIGYIVASKIVTDENENIIVVTKCGQVVSFEVSMIRSSNRGVKGVKVITLDTDDEVVCLL